jgi:AraC-like DNA-binding protein
MHDLPLSGFPALRSDDLDQVRAFLATKGLKLGLRGGARSGRFETRINAAFLPNMWICVIAYGVPVEVRADADRLEYALQFRLAGDVDAVVGRTDVTCGAHRAAIGSPGLSQALISSGDGVRMTLSIARDALSAHLAALLGEPVEAAPLFDPVFDLDGKRGRGLAGCLHWAVGQLERDGAVFTNDLLAAQIEHYVMTGLLLGQQNTYRERLERATRPIAPRDVKRVVDYIEAHPELPLTVADLVGVAGVPGRTLFQHFRAFKGMSPIAYLRKVRFERAREEMLRRDGGKRITDIAVGAGFSHLGRFSIGYRRLFGETPSQTLRRRRKADA